MFKFGKVFMTRGVAEMMTEENRDFGIFVADSLIRHCCGDWGDLCEEDKKVNEDALKYGDRLFSAYGEENHTKIWIITEADRSATTVLFPDEY